MYTHVTKNLINVETKYTKETLQFLTFFFFFAIDSTRFWFKNMISEIGFKMKKIVYS